MSGKEAWAPLIHGIFASHNEGESPSLLILENKKALRSEDEGLFEML